MSSVALGSHPERPTTPPLPTGALPLSHQIAGHRHGQGKTKLGFLQWKHGTVLKPVQPPPKGLRELQFYQQMFDKQCRDPLLLSLRPWLPYFYGTWESPEVENVTFMKLQDLVHRYRKPCIADIKIGAITYDPDASAEKIQSDRSKYPHLDEVGFQILGMRVYNKETNGYTIYDKFYGRKLTPTAMTMEGLPNFFIPQDMSRQRKLLQNLLLKLGSLLAWFEGQRQFSFISSSLLLVYEGDMDEYHESTQNNANNSLDAKGEPMNLNHSERNTEEILNCNNSSGSEKQNSLNDETEALGKIVEKEKSVTVKMDSGIANDSDSQVQHGIVKNAQKEEYNLNKAGCDSETPMNKCNGQDGLRNHCYDINAVDKQNDVTNTSVDMGGRDDIQVKMIDFAHVHPTDARDDNYLFGLRSLIGRLEKVLSTISE